MTIRLREGFRGQKQWVIPRAIVQRWSTHPMLQPLMPTDIGWYPAARYHYREREQGADEHLLIVCVAGAGWYEIDGVKGTVQPDEALIIPRGTPHSLRRGGGRTLDDPLGAFRRQRGRFLRLPSAAG